jgi:hypothetical protein
MANIDPKLVALAKMIPGITDGSSPDAGANGIPSILADAIAASASSKNDFNATKPPEPEKVETDTPLSSGIPKVFTDAINSAPDGQSAASALIKASREYGGQPLTDHMNWKMGVEDQKSEENASDSGVPKIFSSALTAPKPDFNVTKTPPANDDAVPSIFANAARPNVTKVPIAPGTLAANVQAAKITANEPDAIPAAIRSALDPSVISGPSAISDIAKPDGTLAAQTPDLHESLGHKIMRYLPIAAKVAGVVGGGMEAAGSPGHEAPAANLFQQSIEAQANRALAARKLDIEQQNANTNEGYKDITGKAALTKQNENDLMTISDPDEAKALGVPVGTQMTRKEYAAQAKQGLSNTGGNQRATIKADSATQLAQFKAMLDQGKVAFTKPTIDDNGQAVWGAYDKHGNLIKTLDRSIGPAWLQPTVRSSVQVKERADGGYDYIPITSTTRRVFSGAGGGAQPTQGGPSNGGMGGNGGSSSGFSVIDPSAPSPNVTTTGKTSPQGSVNPGGGGTARPVPANAVRPVNDASGGQVFGKAGGDVGYAFNPTDGTTVQTTRMASSQNGLQNFRKVSQDAMENDRQAINRLQDVETKLNRYGDAMASTALSSDDQDRLAYLLNSDKFKLGALGVEVPIDEINKFMRQNQLGSFDNPAAGTKAFYAYKNATEAMNGYNRVLTGGSRSSDKTMELNLATLPLPTDPKDAIAEGINQFRENIPIIRRGLPILPGVNGTIARPQNNKGGGANIPTATSPAGGATPTPTPAPYSNLKFVPAN